MRKTTAALAALGVVAGLGAAALPMSSYAVTTATSDSTDVTIRATINSAISLAVDQTEVDLGTIIVNGAPATGSIKATVSTGDTSGYNLKIVGKDDAKMYAVDATGTPISGGSSIDTLATGATLGDSASAWAFKGGKMSSWTAIPATAPVEINKLESATTGHDTEITFGVYAANGQAPGTYEGNVTLTAAINNPSSS